jgi:hypothetical protein
MAAQGNRLHDDALYADIWRDLAETHRLVRLSLANVSDFDAQGRSAGRDAMLSPWALATLGIGAGAAFVTALLILLACLHP